MYIYLSSYIYKVANSCPWYSWWSSYVYCCDIDIYYTFMSSMLFTLVMQKHWYAWQYLYLIIVYTQILKYRRWYLINNQHCIKVSRIQCDSSSNYVIGQNSLTNYSSSSPLLQSARLLTEEAFLSFGILYTLLPLFAKASPGIPFGLG